MQKTGDLQVSGSIRSNSCCPLRAIGLMQAYTNNEASMMTVPKITTLRQAQAIVDRAAKYPVAGFDEHGNVYINGDRYGAYHVYALNGSDDDWCIAHYVYGGNYGRGTSKKEALLKFIENNPSIKERVVELKKWRKKAAAIVDKYK